MRNAIHIGERVSDEGAEHGVQELRRVAVSRGWAVVTQFDDEGKSNAEACHDRSSLARVLAGAARREFDVLSVWSLGDLGQSLPQLIRRVNELRAANVHLYVHQEGIDTTGPTGTLTVSIFAALANFQGARARESVQASLARARRNGTKPGRPSSVNGAVRAAIVALRSNDQPIRRIAAQLNVGVGTVYRVLEATPAQGHSHVGPILERV